MHTNGPEPGAHSRVDGRRQREKLRKLAEWHLELTKELAGTVDSIIAITRPAVAHGTTKTDADLYNAGAYASEIGWGNIPPASISQLRKGAAEAWMAGWSATQPVRAE
jgi:hypothetical protein